MAAEWRKVEGWPYEVSNEGGLRHMRGSQEPIVLSAYVRFCLHDGPKRKHALMHRVVAHAFLGPAPTPDHVVNHRNGIKWDNRLENLEWATPRENQIHVGEVLGKGRGATHGRALLTEEQVREIRGRYTGARGEQRAMGKEYGVSQATISQIVRGMGWSHVGGAVPVTASWQERTGAKLTVEQADEVRKEYHGAYGDGARLAAKYGVPRSVIYSTVRRSKGRELAGVHAEGAHHGKAKLSERQVRAIRKAHAEKGLSARALAGRYGVGHLTVCRILSGRTWQHVK